MLLLLLLSLLLIPQLLSDLQFFVISNTNFPSPNCFTHCPCFNHSKAASRLGARARAQCPGTKRHRGALSFVSICCSVAILSPPQLQITVKHE